MKLIYVSLVAVVLGSAALLATASDAVDPVKQALDTAIDDERHALAFYNAVMEVHGQRRPFSNIVFAERRHEKALLTQYDRLGLTPPPDAWADHEFDVPETFAECCDISVVSEVRNARMYEKLAAKVSDPQVLGVFSNLRAASLERHLPAFRRHSNGWTSVDEDALTEPQRAQADTAIDARSTLYASILSELMGALSSKGAADAIDICSKRAPELAAEVGEAKGVSIGRTSEKLRNPQNTPPIWAELLTDETPDTPRYTADRNGRLGALIPIRVSGFCLQCHGKPESLGPGVAEQLAALYPDDRATGYKENDLRGWFWVEVSPKD